MQWFIFMRAFTFLIIFLGQLSVLAVPIIVNTEHEFVSALQTQNITIELNSNILLSQSMNVFYISSLIINGNDFIIDGQNQFTCFNITYSDQISINRLNMHSCKGGGFNLYQSTAVEISDSQIHNSSAVYGGAIFLEESELNLSSCDLYQNEAEFHGGGIYAKGNNTLLIVDNSGIYSNRAGSDGGGLYVYDRVQASLTGSTIYHNSAVNGGGASIITSRVSLSGNVSRNEASQHGGGLYIYGEVDFKKMEVTSNRAVEKGGGVFITGDSSVTSTHFDTCNVQSNDALYGGGVYVRNGVVFMNHTSVAMNQAYSPTFTLLNNSRSTCTVLGGCIYSSNYPSNYNNEDTCDFVAGANGTLVFRSFLTEDKKDILKIGQGSSYSGMISEGFEVDVSENDVLTWTSNSRVSNKGFEICYQLNAAGGGLYVEGGEISLTDCTINANSATSFGGGVYLLGGDTTFESVKVSNNELELNEGVEIYTVTGSFDAVDLTIPSYAIHSIGGSGQSTASCVSSCQPGEFGMCEYNEKSSSSCFVNCNCSSCNAGTFSESSGSVSRSDCIACSPGTYSTDKASECSDCEKGTVSSRRGQRSCKKCPVGKYELDSIYCQPCDTWKTTEFPGAFNASACDQAIEGHFIDYSDPDQPVIDCDLNKVTCFGGDYMAVPRPSYWTNRDPDHLEDFNEPSRCYRDTCLGFNSTNLTCWKYNTVSSNLLDGGDCNDNTLQCLKGSHGPLCASCQKGYRYVTFSLKCKTCTSLFNPIVWDFWALCLPLLTLFILGLMIIFANIVQVWEKATELSRSVLSVLDKSVHFGSFKIVFSTYQILHSITYTMEIKFPRRSSDMMQLLNFINLNFPVLDCVGFSLHEKVYFFSLLPLLLVFLIYLLMKLKVFLLRKTAQDLVLKAADVIEEQHYWSIMFIFYLVVPSVLYMQLSAINCINIEHLGSFVRMDTEIDCHSQEHRNFVFNVAILIQIYAAFPFILLLTIYWKHIYLFPKGIVYDNTLLVERRKLSYELVKIRFFFENSRPQMPYWEVFELFRRIFFVVLIPFSSYSPAKRCEFGLLISFLSLFLFRELMPYKEEYTNHLACFSQFALFLLYFTSLMMVSGDYHGIDYFFGFILSCLNISVVGFLLLGAFFKRKRDREERRKREATLVKTVTPAMDFGRKKYEYTFSLINKTMIPPTHVGVIFYSSLSDINHILTRGISAEDISKEGVVFTLHQPHQLTEQECEIFKFTEAFVVCSLPRRLLQPISKEQANRLLGVNRPEKFGAGKALHRKTTLGDENALWMLPRTVLTAMRGSKYDEVTDWALGQHGWQKGLLVLPPQSIKCAYQALEVSQETSTQKGEGVWQHVHSLRNTANKIIPENLEDGLVMFNSNLRKKVDTIKTIKLSFNTMTSLDRKLLVPMQKANSILKRVHVDMLHPSEQIKVTLTNIDQYLKKMDAIRWHCFEHGQVPLYHYTHIEIAPLILNSGFKLMDAKHIGDEAGVGFSTLGPASNEVGSPIYEKNIITNVHGRSKYQELKDKKRYEVCLVYGIDPMIVERKVRDNQSSSASNTNVIVPKHYFEDFSLPHHDGSYFMRPDRLMGAFMFDHSSSAFYLQRCKENLSLEVRKDYDTLNAIEKCEQEKMKNELLVKAAVSTGLDSHVKILWGCSFDAKKFESAIKAVEAAYVPRDHCLCFYYAKMNELEAFIRSGIPVKQVHNQGVTRRNFNEYLRKTSLPEKTDQRPGSKDSERTSVDSSHTDSMKERKSVDSSSKGSPHRHSNDPNHLGSGDSFGDLGDGRMEGIIFTLHQPDDLTRKEKFMFGHNFEGFLACSVPKGMLFPLEKQKFLDNEQSELYVLPSDILRAMRGNHFGDVIDARPWYSNLLLLPPQCIKRAYQLKPLTADQMLRSDDTILPAGHILDEPMQFDHGLNVHLKYSEVDHFTSPNYSVKMNIIRSHCAELGLIPLFHYVRFTSLPSILAKGLKLNPRSDHEADLHFSTAGPVTFVLRHFKQDVIEDGFGKKYVAREEGESQSRNPDTCVVYGIDPLCVDRLARDKEVFVISKKMFQDFSLLSENGNYFLRPDRVFGAFRLKENTVSVHRASTMLPVSPSEPTKHRSLLPSGISQQISFFMGDASTSRSSIRISKDDLKKESDNEESDENDEDETQQGIQSQLQLPSEETKEEKRKESNVDKRASESLPKKTSTQNFANMQALLKKHHSFVYKYHVNEHSQKENIELEKEITLEMVKLLNRFQQAKSRNELIVMSVLHAVNERVKVEWACTFTPAKFATTFSAVATSSVPATHCLVFHYASVNEVNKFVRCGIKISDISKEGILFTLHQPTQLTKEERSAFKRLDALVACSIPRKLLYPYQHSSLSANDLRSTEHSKLFLLPVNILLAMRGSYFGSVVNPKPWIQGELLLSPHCIKRAYQLTRFQKSDHLQSVHSMRTPPPAPPSISSPNRLPPTSATPSLTSVNEAEVDSDLLKSASLFEDSLFGDKLDDKDVDFDDSDDDDDEKKGGNSQTLVSKGGEDSLDIVFTDTNRYVAVSMSRSASYNKSFEFDRADSVKEVITCTEYLEDMNRIRQHCEALGLLPLYHYTSTTVAPQIIRDGFRMSTSGHGDGGVYFSTRGPASYGLGTDKYEANIIIDCFGKDKLEEYLGERKLDVCFVYGVDPLIVEQVVGDTSAVVSKGFFESFSLPEDDGSYLLRGDRLFGAFSFLLLDDLKLSRGDDIELQQLVEKEIERDLLVQKSLIPFNKEKLRNDVLIKSMTSVVDNSVKVEWACNFSAIKFATTFNAVMSSSVPATHFLVFHYASLTDIEKYVRCGIPIKMNYSEEEGILFSLNGPKELTKDEIKIFRNREACIACALPRKLLLPVHGVSPSMLRYSYDASESSKLCILSQRVLRAMRGSYFGDVADPRPWFDGVLLLPPQCIKRAYQLIPEEEIIQTEKRHSELAGLVSTMFCVVDQTLTEGIRDSLTSSNSQPEEEGKEEANERTMSIPLKVHQPEAVEKMGRATEYLDAMLRIRQQCEALGLVPLYHYTSMSVAPFIFRDGFRMSTSGQGDGGVYFSTRGPASYGLGTDKYEANIIIDCFGKERLEEYLGEHKLDVCFVYGVDPLIVEQAPGGRDNAVVVPKLFFEDFSLPHEDGNYFLRPDRLMAAFSFCNTSADENETTLLLSEAEKDMEVQQYMKKSKQAGFSLQKDKEHFSITLP